MQALDEAVLLRFVEAGQSHPALWTAARWLTELGGWRGLCALTAVVALGLLVKGHRRRAMVLAVTTLGVRVPVELLKAWTDRPRPHLIDHPVVVHSQSFPSGHAANSMAFYLALALVVVPVVTRTRGAVPAAVALSAAIGLTRPLLGVHYLSDVVAGWALGLAWTLGSVWLLGRWMAGQPARS